MSWRGQGGRRAKGRRGDQDPELDNTAWLAELEREAAQADDDEDDWADTLRSRRAGGGGSPGPQRPGYPAPGPPPADAPPPAPRPSASSAFEQAPPADDPGWAVQDPRDAAPDPDWAWRQPGLDPYGEPPPGRGEFGSPQGPAQEEFGSAGQRGAPEADLPGSPRDPGNGGWHGAGADAPTGAWSPSDSFTSDSFTSDPGYAPSEPPYSGFSEPAYPDAPLAGREPNYPTGYPEAREGEPPVGREPDYPALFGELYRRSAGQQDPIWEAPPPVEPLPETGPAEPVTGTWPFEETTQSWEPSDRSFVWPSDELPSAPAEWEQPSPAPWDEPARQPQARPEPPDPELDQTAGWSAPDPAPRPSAWAGRPGTGNGMPPSPAGPLRPPPDDWAAAIPTDVPAAERAADPASATRAWRPDDAADAEPGVPLGPGAAQPGGYLGPGAAPPGGYLGPGAAPPVGGAAARTSRHRGGADPRAEGDPAAGATGVWAGPGAGVAGTRSTGRADALAADRRGRDPAAGAGYQAGVGLADEPGDIRRKGSAGRRPAGERQARAWPRIVAIISWIVLVMVVCWFYVFPWLERVLPENF
jgi:hypothetical protein